ncbi:hypothetical protein CNR22_13225 [Sphingobacteriaceae bacterium]|nr:hypothetical protein CNR22_13225 [Sphingobacteriaceae bacterium]
MKNSILASLLVLSQSLFAIETKPGNENRGFTENKGQIHDQHFSQRPDILFSGFDGRMDFHIGAQGISYQLSRVENRKEQIDPKTLLSRSTPASSTVYRVDVKWLGTNSGVSVKKGLPLVGYNNYYLSYSNDPVLNVQSYGDITLENIYKNIDLHYYYKNGVLKYDYVVKPNTDYQQIKLQIKGADIEIQSDGSLLLKTPLGAIQEGAPLVYQNGIALKAKWKIDNDVLSFSIQNYNPSLPLLIDPPTRVWGTYYGAGGTDNFEGVVTDGANVVYAVGQSASSGMATIGAHQTTLASYRDALLVKFNGAGSRTWSTYYGGAADDFGHACTVDASGNIYMAGETWSTGTVSIATPGAHQTVHSASTTSNGDAFLVKFTSAGVRIWGTYYGGTGFDTGLSCSTDKLGNIYMSGQTSSGSDIATSGGFQTGLIGSTTAFLVKFDASGVRQWGTYYGNYNDVGSGCKTDTLNNVYMTGRTFFWSFNQATVVASPGSHQAGSGGSSDAFLVKFDANGSRLWGTYYGGSGEDYGYACSVDKNNNVFIVGQSSSIGDTSIASNNSYQSVNTTTTTDAFAAKFNASGVRQWGTYYGGSGLDIALSCFNDTLGNLYFSGLTTTSTSSIMSSPNSHQNIHAGNRDAFFTKFNGVGQRQWSTYYGGTGDDVGFACAGDITGRYYVAGETHATTGSATAIATSSAFQTSIGGTAVDDGFLVKFNDCAPAIPTAIMGTTLACSSLAQHVYSIAAIATATAYTWTFPPAWTNTAISANIFSVNPNQNGTLSISASNSCGTSPNLTLDVVYAQSPTVTVSNGTICPGDYFDIAPNGALTYSISGNSSVVNPNTTTNYTVTGINAEGCTSTAIANISVAPSPVISVNGGTLCAGSTFTILPSGASTYTYSSGLAQVSPNQTATYTVSGSSALGCISSNSPAITVTVFAQPSITVSSGTICNGQSFSLSPTGANTYTISGGSAQVSPTITSSYSVTGSSVLGCVSSNTALATVTVFARPTVTVSSGIICNGDSYTLTPSGASSYSFSSSSPVISPSVTSNYSVTGMSAEGCTSTNTAVTTITVNPSPTISISSGSICSGESFTLNPSGAMSYTFSNGYYIVSPSATTSYSVIGSNQFSCVSQQPVVAVVTVYQKPVISVNSGNVCYGSSFTLTPTGATNYTVSGNSFVVSPLSFTTYTLVGSNVPGCNSNSVVSSVNVNPLPTITVNSGSVCTGQTFVISPNGAGPNGSYTVTGGSFNISPSSNSTYTVSGTSSFGCASTSFVVSSVSVVSLPVISVTSDQAQTCTGEFVLLTASGADTYNWQQGPASANYAVAPVTTSTYVVTGINLSGCTQTASIVQNVSDCSGIANAEGNASDVSVFPNPFQDEFVISSTSISHLTLKLINTLGQIVLEQELSSGETKIRASELAAGVYYISLTDATKTLYVKKFVKE